MSRHELVQGYLDGQLSRRVFMRRLVATGVSAAAALSYASLLDSSPAQAAALGDFYLSFSDFTFPATFSLAQGDSQELRNFGPSVHNVEDATGLNLYDSGDVNVYGPAVLGPMPGAGTWRYRCDDTGHQEMKGRFQVPVVVTPTQAPKGSTFTIRWATSQAPTGLVFDVQRQQPGQGNFRVWRNGVRAAAATMTPTERGRYHFRARVRRPSNGAQTGWSPTATFRVT